MSKRLQRAKVRVSRVRLQVKEFWGEEREFYRGSGNDGGEIDRLRWHYHTGRDALISPPIHAACTEFLKHRVCLMTVTHGKQLPSLGLSSESLITLPAYWTEIPVTCAKTHTSVNLENNDSKTLSNKIKANKTIN